MLACISYVHVLLNDGDACGCQGAGAVGTVSDGDACGCQGAGAVGTVSDGDVCGCQGAGAVGTVSEWRGCMWLSVCWRCGDSEWWGCVWLSGCWRCGDINSTVITLSTSHSAVVTCHRCPVPHVHTCLPTAAVCSSLTYFISSHNATSTAVFHSGHLGSRITVCVTASACQRCFTASASVCRHKPVGCLVGSVVVWWVSEWVRACVRGSQWLMYCS